MNANTSEVFFHFFKKSKYKSTSLNDYCSAMLNVMVPIFEFLRKLYSILLIYRFSVLIFIFII